MADKTSVDQEKLAQQWEAEQASSGNAQKNVHQPNFAELKGEQGNGEARDIEFLLDVPLVISVELGRTQMLINDLLQLGQGSVVELDKLAGEPMEILINQRLVARGEVVVVNEKFGIRLTDIISPAERLKQLK